jgi:putative radical SAM enzyme (TIGR03279 family)
MNPELRCKMLNNRFAGDALKKVDRLNEADIEMNGQIVLCKGVNDKEELVYSIDEMMKYIPNLRSVSVVPVGLSKYRDGLYPLEPFDKEDAEAVIDTIEKYQKICMDRYGIHFIHASDEWYILAGRQMPEEERYDGYLQLENGVGMIRLLLNEFDDAIKKLERERKLPDASVTKEVSVATGRLATPYIRKMCAVITKVFPNINIHVYEIVNNFFGEMITVSGLLTGQDICGQLKDKRLGETLLLPQNVLRSGETVFLDDLTVEDLEKTLQVKINIVKSSGYDFLNAFME